MTKLKISADLALPIEAVTEAIGFLGRRGSGKSYAAQKLAEQFHHAGAQFVALDPVGNWWALRLAADGKSPGLPITIFGGLQGDVPLDSNAGKMVADVIVDRGISAVIDVSQFESDAAKARFAEAFCERFYFRKKSSPSAVFLFLEEAQEFIAGGETGRASRRESSADASIGSGPVSKSTFKVLKAVAQYDDGVDRDQLSALTGLRTSTRNEYLRQLSVAGFVQVAGSRVVATEAGIEALGDDYEPLPTGDALQQFWLSRLPDGQARLLRVLIAHYPAAIDRESLSESVGLRASTRNEYLRQLIVSRIVEVVGPGEVRASATLFEES